MKIFTDMMATLENHNSNLIELRESVDGMSGTLSELLDVQKKLLEFFNVLGTPEQEFKPSPQQFLLPPEIVIDEEEEIRAMEFARLHALAIEQL